MNNIYENANDVHVRGTVVYLIDGEPFYDKESTKPVSGEELIRMFEIGTLLFDEFGGAINKPINYTIDTENNQVLMTYLVIDDETLKLTTVNGKLAEKTAE